MKILVAYATRHGATRGIAERIRATLEGSGHEVTLKLAHEAGEVGGYDAFVVGSATYMGQWLDDATIFVRRHRSELAARPVWLFSSGPIGTQRVDAKGRSVLDTSRPYEFTEFGPQIHPRDERVFFGAYDPDAEPIGFVERLGSMFTRIPAVREAMPAGDFRDWPAIEAWAEQIASELGRAHGRVVQSVGA